MSIRDRFNITIHRDFFDLVCGDRIGYGVHREVYEFLPNSDLVLKIETQGKSFENQAEWRTWAETEDTPNIQKWLAPCRGISPCGVYLLQERTYRPDKYPDKVPAWLCDFKRTNFGILKNGDFVCHDYGSNFLNRYGRTKRLKKANWWEWKGGY